MAFDRKTIKALRTFAHTVVVSRQGITSSGRWMSVPPGLREEAKQAGLNPDCSYMFDEQDDRAWLTALRQLGRERDLEHLNRRELEKDLESLFWDVTINHSKSKDLASRNAIVQKYITERETAVKPYQVIIPIEHLDQSETPIKIAEVTLRSVTNTDVSEWFANGGSGQYFDQTTLVPGSVVATTMVSGQTLEVVRDRAQAKVDLSLDALRVAIADFSFRIYDEQLRFARSPITLITDPMGGPIIWRSMASRHEPTQPGLTNEHLDTWTRGNLMRLDRIWADSIKSKLLADCERAVRWVGRSIRAKDFDDKLIALCTAQECLLSSNSCGLKTVDLAIRSMVLGELSGEGFTHPKAIIKLYETRSDVVHGTTLGVASDKMYRFFLGHTLDVLYQVLNLIAITPQLTTKHQLITFLDDQESLVDCLKWCESEDPNDTMGLQAELRKRIPTPLG